MAQDVVYSFSLRNGSPAASPSPFISFVSPPSDSNGDGWYGAVLKINVGSPALNNPYDVAEVQVKYDGVPQGMTVNIGDSATNDGFSGDGGTQSNDAEMHIGTTSGVPPEYATTMQIQGRDGTNPPTLATVSNIAANGRTLDFIIKDQFIAWDNHQGIVGNLTSPQLYALSGQSDTEGSVNYDIFAAFNQVVAGNYRWGSGAGSVTIRLRDLDGDAGNNTLIGTPGNDRMRGYGGNDTLKGLAGNDLLDGGAGIDKLYGGSGNDSLTGGGGADRFTFESGVAFSSSAFGIDTITDFIKGTDKIVLDKTAFSKLTSVAGNGFSVRNEFAVVTSDALAATSNALIVYNQGNGKLFYNENKAGSGFGTGAQFAILSALPATPLSGSDFIIQN